MAMESIILNPHFEAETFKDGTHWYSLVFDGFDGIENVDDDGDEFYYEVTCEDVVWNHADAFANGYSWFFDKIYEDDSTKAEFSDSEVEAIIHTMLEAIKNGGIE